MQASFGLVKDRQTRGDVPKDFTTTAVLATWGEAEVPGPFALLTPLLRRRSNSPADRQRETELMSYCT